MVYVQRVSVGLHRKLFSECDDHSPFGDNCGELRDLRANIERPTTVDVAY